MTIIVAFLLDIIDGEVASRRVLTLTQYEFYDKFLDLWWYSGIFIYTLVVYPEHIVFFSILYLYRFFGEIIFFIFRKREVFLLFPNLIENAFLLIYFYEYLVGLSIFDSKLLYFYLSVAFFLKLFQEFVVHIKKVIISEYFFGIKKEWLEYK